MELRDRDTFLLRQLQPVGCTSLFELDPNAVAIWVDAQPWCWLHFCPVTPFFCNSQKKKLFWVGGLLRCLQSTFVLSAELLFPFSRQLLSRPTCMLPLSSWFYFSKRKKRNVLRASIWQLSCKSDNASLNRRDLVISNRHLPLLISHLEKSNLLLLWEPFRRER